MDVKLNLDRNGIVTSIDPEAVVLKAGESVVYRLVEPGRDTNWEFLGVQLGGNQEAFSQVEIFDGTQLMLKRGAGKFHGEIETTLLYTLDKDTYYDSGNPSETSAKKLKKKQSVKAFDPLIIGEN